MKEKAFEIGLKLKNDGYQIGLMSMVNTFSAKKTASRANINEVLAQELHQPLIKNFKREERLSQL